MSHCPKDNGLLASNDVSGYRYYSCEQCGGYWIPGMVLGRVLSSRGVGELRAVVADGKSESDCPACRTAFDTLEVSGCSFERCRACGGVWLDSGAAVQLRRLFPERSAVVDADECRLSEETRSAIGTFSVVDLILNLLAGL